MAASVSPRSGTEQENKAEWEKQLLLLNTHLSSRKRRNHHTVLKEEAGHRKGGILVLMRISQAFPCLYLQWLSLMQLLNSASSIHRYYGQTTTDHRKAYLFWWVNGIGLTREINWDSNCMCGNSVTCLHCEVHFSAETLYVRSCSCGNETELITPSVLQQSISEAIWGQSCSCHAPSDT